MSGVSTTIAAVATAFRVLYWWRQQCKQISNGCLEIFKQIITLLTVTVLFLFTFSIWLWMHLLRYLVRGSRYLLLQGVPTANIAKWILCTSDKILYLLFIWNYSIYRKQVISLFTLRPTAPLAFLLGGGSKIRCCRLGGRVEYSGIHFMSPANWTRINYSFRQVTAVLRILIQIRMFLGFLDPDPLVRGTFYHQAKK